MSPTCAANCKQAILMVSNCRVPSRGNASAFLRSKTTANVSASLSLIDRSGSPVYSSGNNGHDILCKVGTWDEGIPGA
jgi:hypothetical protein